MRRSVALVICWTATGLAAQETPQGSQQAAAEPPRVWVARLADLARAEEAERWLRAAGADAVLPLTEAVADLSGEAQVRAVRILGALGEVALPAVSELAALAGGDCSADLLEAVYGALSEIGPYAEDRDALRSGLVTALLGPRGIRAVPSLAKVLHRLEVDPGVGDTELVELLASEHVHRREFAAQLLGRRRVPGAVAALREAVVGDHPKGFQVSCSTGRGNMSMSSGTDLGEQVRAAASRALVATAGERPVAAPAHAWLVQHGELTERRRAAMTIGRLGVRDEGVVDALVEVLKREVDTVTLREAVTSLGVVGEAAAAAVPLLEGLREHDDPQIAQRAAAALRQIGHQEN